MNRVDEIKLSAIKRESERLQKKIALIAKKIEQGSTCGSTLIEAHNKFAKSFNSSSDKNERLGLIEKYESDKKRIMSYFKYDICALIDEKIVIESEIREIESEVAIMEWRDKGRKQLWTKKNKE